MRQKSRIISMDFTGQTGFSISFVKSAVSPRSFFIFGLLTKLKIAK